VYSDFLKYNLDSPSFSLPCFAFLTNSHYCPSLTQYAAREAEIVAQAGRKHAITISTNMAGRGTDIILGGNPKVGFPIWILVFLYFLYF